MPDQAAGADVPREVDAEFVVEKPLQGGCQRASPLPMRFSGFTDVLCDPGQCPLRHRPQRVEGRVLDDKAVAGVPVVAVVVPVPSGEIQVAPEWPRTLRSAGPSTVSALNHPAGRFLGSVSAESAGDDDAVQVSAEFRVSLPELASATRIRVVTAARAFSVGSPVRRGPCNPYTELSSPVMKSSSACTRAPRSASPSRSRSASSGQPHRPGRRLPLQRLESDQCRHTNAKIDVFARTLQ